MKIGIIRDIPAWKKCSNKNNLSLIQNVKNEDLLSAVTEIKDKTMAYKCLLFITQGNYPDAIKVAANKLLTASTLDFQKSCLNKNETHLIEEYCVTGEHKDPNVFHISFANWVKNINSFPVDVKTEKQGENIVSTLKRTFLFNKKLNYCQIENGEYKKFTFAAKLAHFYAVTKCFKNECKSKNKNAISVYNEVNEDIYEVYKKMHPERYK